MNINTKVKQHPERSVPDQAAAFLTDGIVASVAIIDEGVPYIIPFTYQYEPEENALYLHGGLSSRALQCMVSMPIICAELTLVDGMVLSKSSKYYSVNYRSVLCFGKASVVEDLTAKSYYLQRMIERYHPNRKLGTDYLASSEKELAATLVVKIAITEMSAKQRSGGPKGPGDNDTATPGTAGVIEIPSGIQAYLNTQPK